MSENLPAEKRVYSVELQADFYVLASSVEEAEEIAKREFPLTNIDIELPVGATPDYRAHAIANNSEYYRQRCVNV